LFNQAKLNGENCNQFLIQTIKRSQFRVLTQGSATSRYFILPIAYHRTDQNGFVCILNGREERGRKSHCLIQSIDHTANETGAVNGTYLRGRQRDKRRGHLLVKLK